MPFKRACKELSHFVGTEVSASTARRLSQRAGADYVEVQDQRAQTILEQHPSPPCQPQLQLMSVDGAFVPLTNGESLEVKTLAIGEVTQRRTKAGEPQIKTVDLSYFSRTSEASAFTIQAVVETHRRGTEKAHKVCAVTDGAAWEQSFIDYHRRDAVRILDFPHAAGYVAESGRQEMEEESSQYKKWFEQQCKRLKHGEEDEVLKEMKRLKKRASRRGDEEAREVIESSLNYLEKRREMIEYEKFQALGYPIGSGSVESANKIVVESRLKQAGMRWKKENIDPMLGLRNIACNERWEEAWEEIFAHNRERVEKRRQERMEKREGAVNGKIHMEEGEAKGREPKAEMRELVRLVKEAKKGCRPKKEPYRPAADHPWRRMPIGRARYKLIA